MKQPNVRHRLTSLLLFVLLVRAVVPVGFMLAPSRADATDLTVVICTAHGVQTLAPDQNDKPSRSNAKTWEDCPFAASAFPGLASEAMPLSVTAEYAATVYTLARLQFSLTPLPGATSARGPPRVV
jgi:hypothetical protein